jgi:fluoride exporter
MCRVGKSISTFSYKGQRLAPMETRRSKENKALQKYFWIAVGGSLGSIARYWVGSTVASRMGTRFPYGTFVINITACLIIGFAMAFLARRTEFNAAWRFLIPVGFVGAYSTFSTFEWETYSSLQMGDLLIAGLYVFLSLVVGFAGVWCGVMLAKVIS